VQTCAGHAICPSWAQYIVVLIPASTFMNDVLKNILKKNKFLYYYFLGYFYFFIRSCLARPIFFRKIAKIGLKVCLPNTSFGQKSFYEKGGKPNRMLNV